MLNEVSPESEINNLIQEYGKISFAKFMELALFSPNGGYYTSSPEDRHNADYYTAPLAHPAFGALIAIQLEQMWETLGCPAQFYVVEMGSGQGALARDILDYSNQLNMEFAVAIRYISIDYTLPLHPSANIQTILAKTLPFRNVVGCVLSNELIDAMPVHRFIIHNNRLQEIFVGLKMGFYEEIFAEPSCPALVSRISNLKCDLPDGFRGEVNLAAMEWVRNVANMLYKGFVITVDYGHQEEDLYSSQRSGGTLRCYYDHMLSDNPYKRIGRQDITSHVDFTLLRQTGEIAGLETLGLIEQGAFLNNLGFRKLWDNLSEQDLTQHQLDSNRMGMLELVKPDGFGNFKVHIQSKNLPNNFSLVGLSPKQREPQLEPNLVNTPLISKRHVNIMLGRYPHLSWDWNNSWSDEYPS